MRHPLDGTLRRLLDEPAAVADVDHSHVARCDVCQAALASVRDDAALASAALAPTIATTNTADDDLDAAWRRLTARLAEPARRKRTVRSGRRRWHAALRRPALAAAGVGVLLAGAGAAAAADWLPIFRTERVAPVVLDADALTQLPDLSSYGRLEIDQPAEIRRVADAAAAEEATGLDAFHVTELPRGVVGEPEYRVGSTASAVFTFDAERAAATAAAEGTELPAPPPGIDGSQFRLEAGPGIAAVWHEARGVPALVIGRAVAPTGYSTGIPFDVARDYLLTLPGLPDEVAAQLRAFSADGSTLPLPLGDPDGSLDTSEADVDGHRATVIALRGGAVAAVVWVDDGVITAVAGLLSTGELLDVARGLT